MAVLIVSTGLTGCGHGRPPIPVEEAPYVAVDENRLRVREDLVPRLKFAKVLTNPIVAEVTGLGQIAFAPGASCAVRAPFEGFVETVHVDVGQEIQHDQLLATIRSSELAKVRADVRRLTAELDAELDAQTRQKDLLSKGVVSERRAIEANARVGSLEAQREGLQQALRSARTTEKGDDLYELRAACSGDVIARRIDPGEQVNAPENSPAFMIGDPTRLVVRASFPERDAPLLHEGYAAKISIPSLGRGVIEGTVSAVVRAIDPKSRTVQAVCHITSPDTRLRAEMLAEVQVEVEGKGTLRVPRSALLLRRDDRVVLVRRGERELERCRVEIGANFGSEVEIVSGLTTGDEVVVEGAVLLDGELDQLI